MGAGVSQGQAERGAKGGAEPKPSGGLAWPAGSERAARCNGAVYLGPLPTGVTTIERGIAARHATHDHLDSGGHAQARGR